MYIYIIIINQTKKNKDMDFSKETYESKLTSEYGLKSEVYPLGQDVTFFGTEIEVLRLAQKFNGKKESKVFFSENLNTWCVCFPYWFSIESAQRITETKEEEVKEESKDASFEVGKLYGNDLTFEVIKRTAKFITIKSTFGENRVKIKSFGNAETGITEQIFFRCWNVYASELFDAKKSEENTLYRAYYL